MTGEDSSKLEFEAATSALLEYGFSKALIKRTLKDILNVYDGNKAWPLIKENGYEVVIERLISNEGSQQRKSQRKAQHGFDKERKQHELDRGAGGLSGSKLCSSSPLLVTPTLDTENIDIQAHQGISWTKNGLFPLPEWFKAFYVSNKEKQQKVVDLHLLLERIDNNRSKQAHCVNHCTFDVLAVKDECIEETGFTRVSGPEVVKKHIDNVCSKQGHCVNRLAFDVLAVKDEKSECASFSRPKVVKNKEAVNTPDLTNEGLANTLTNKISNRHSEPFNKPGILLKADFGTGFQKQGSNSTFLKTLKPADSVHADHADTCLQPSSPAMPQIQKLADVLPSQHDVSPVALEATGIKHYRRKNSLGNDDKRRKGVCKYQETLEPVAATQSMPPRTQSTGENTNNLPSTFYVTERLDIARMSACKLTRRRDGGPNPMFSRLQKCKQAGAGGCLQTNQQESSDLNASESGVPAMDVDADEGTRSKKSPELPPGLWKQSVDNHRDGEAALPDPVSPASPELPPGFWNCSCADPSHSPELPPGFWEPSGILQDPIVSSQIKSEDPILSDESPLLPPGFSEPLDDDSSQESPRLPPGFSEPFEKAAQRSELSPDLPPGFWEHPGTRKIFRSPEPLTTKQRKTLRGGLNEENWCSKNFIECKGTLSKQVFVANIPEEFDGVEQKLYSLVREVLEGFRSVPISAVLPRKIQVKGDHASVEFCCEAMAGIFVDAYHTNASAFKIDSEQLLAARNIHLMKRDIQLRLAVSNRLKGQLLDPRNTFFLGNVPSEWQNEARLFSHLASLLQGDASRTFITKTLTIYTIPDFSDVYVYFQSNVLAETFFLRCLSDKEHLEEISASLFVCRNSTFLPRASRVCIAST